MGLNDKVRWRSALRAVITADGAELVIRTTDGVTRVPSSARAGLERLQHGEVLPVADLDADSADSSLALARTLLRSCLTVLA